jgi:phosphatidylglycerophosphate synthase
MVPTALRGLRAAGAMAGAAAAGAAALLNPGAPLPAAAAALLVAAAATAWAAAVLRDGHPHGAFGPANRITFARLAVAGVLAGALGATVVGASPLADPARAWTLTGLAALALALDGVDGWVARRTGLASAFGARLDMETDALTAALLCVLAIAAGKAGLWLLPLGLLRYVWVAAGTILPALRGPLPPRAGRREVCALQVGTLVALLAPPVGATFAALLALAATAALLWSFGRDAVFLLRSARG